MTNGHLSRSDQGTSGKAESSCNVGAYALEMRILQSQVKQHAILVLVSQHEALRRPNGLRKQG